MKSRSTRIEFHLFRHGETDWNRLGRMQGRTEIPLNSLGVQQARELRNYFGHDSSSREKWRVVSSPLGRAFETTKLAFPHHDVSEILIEPRFVETNLGAAEGLTREEIFAQIGTEPWEQWLGLGPESWNARFPRGESKGEVRDRVVAGLTGLVEQVENLVPNARFCEEVVRFAVGTHGGVIRRLLHHLNPSVPEAIEVINGSVFVVSYSEGVYSGVSKPVHVPKNVG